MFDLELDIPRTLFTEPKFTFAVFDIETLESKTDINSKVEAELKILSIRGSQYT